MYSKVKKMLEMQKELDAAIYKEHNAKFSEEECKLAIIDEIGELNHELKSTWCWWKKTQKEADRKKALMELCDLWHFVMNYHYHYYSRVYDDKYLEWLDCDYEFETLSNVYKQIIETPSIELMIILTYRLDYSIDEVYDAYIEKNKVNYERLANNY